MRRVRLPIWVVLAIAFGGLTAISAAVVGFLFYLAAIDNARDLARDVGGAQVSRIAATVDAQFQPAADQARFLADYISRGHVGVGDEQRLRDLLLGSVGAVRQLAGVAFVRPDRQMIWAAAISEGRSYVTERVNMADRADAAALMRRAQTTRASFWAGPIAFAAQEPLLIAVSPVVGENGRFLGAVVAAVSLRSASVRLAALASDDLVPFVVTEQGRIVMHSAARIGDILSRPGAAMPDVGSGFDPILAATSWPPRNMIPSESAEDASGVGVAEADAGGVSHYVVFRRVAGYSGEPWYIGYHVPQSWIAALFQTINSATSFAVILVGVALLLALWLGRAIGNPIRLLAENAQRIARLDLDTPPPRGSRLLEIDLAASAQTAMRNGLVWLNNYIPRTLAPVLLKSGEAVASRQSEIVVLFTDIVGFSGIAEGRDAASLAALLNRHFALLGEIIEREGGTIDKYIGDSIMAFWGAPLTQEDRAERALRAAAAIARTLAADNRRRAGKGLRPIRIRMGLHQGTALVGNIGAPGRINYTLVGDTVNIAQRLEQFGRQVDDGTRDAVIVISAELKDHLPEGTSAIDLGKHTLTGRSSPEHLYRLQAV